jgi:hypothetical protein
MLILTRITAINITIGAFSGNDNVWRTNINDNERRIFLLNGLSPYHLILDRKEMLLAQVFPDIRGCLEPNKETEYYLVFA